MSRPANTPRTLAIVGSGVAGLCAALEAVRLGLRVSLLTKGSLGDGNSSCAQGGLSAVTTQGEATGDSVASHVTDTLRAGAWHGTQEAVQELCGSANDLVNILEEHSVQFDKDAAGNYQLGLEAAHSAHRILHAGGDATGAGLVAALASAVRAAKDAGQLDLIENAFVVDIEVTEAETRSVNYLQDDAIDQLHVDAVLLATGGLGSLYAASTNPHGATADGIGLAARAGAVISDMEFIQFHPTLVDPQLYPEAGMISEAVRGEGAVLINELGERFMIDIDELAELAPRDVVARAIHAQYQAGHQVFIDARAVETAKGAGFLARRFPSITARLKACSLDMALAPIPVVAAQHYAMGGIHTDTQGRTSVPGMYAAGECANTTVHGANRLASNSLLEAMVFARKAVHAAATDEPGSACDLNGLVVGELPETQTQDPMELIQLKKLASEHLGVYRTGVGLQQLMTVLDSSAPVAPEPRAQSELNNLYTCARLIAYAAQQRTQSLGAHHRLDANDQEATANNIRYGWVLSGVQSIDHQLKTKEVNA